MPRDYFDAASAAAVLKFRAKALAQRGPDVLADFPAVDVEGKSARAWRAPAVRIYANWLSLLLKSRFVSDERAIE
jgi:homoserine O-succinyltransferase